MLPSENTITPDPPVDQSPRRWFTAALDGDAGQVAPEVWVTLVPGPVAQWSEQRTHNPSRPGSNPGGPIAKDLHMRRFATRWPRWIHLCMECNYDAVQRSVHTSPRGHALEDYL